MLAIVQNREKATGPARYLPHGSARLVASRLVSSRLVPSRLDRRVSTGSAVVISHVPRASFIPNKTRLKTDNEREREKGGSTEEWRKSHSRGRKNRAGTIFISRRLNPLREVSRMHVHARVLGHYANPQPGGFRWLMDGLENP